MNKGKIPLIVFRKLMKNSIIRAYNIADKSNSPKDWRKFFYKIIKKAEKKGLSGNILSSYIIYLLAQGNNPIASRIQCSGDIGQGLEKMLRLDMKKLYPYLNIKVSGNNSYAEIINEYEPSHMCNDEPYMELLQNMAKAESADEAARILVNHYKKYGSGKLANYKAFYWNRGKLKGITYFEKVEMADLIGYEKQKRLLLDNTAAFINNRPANNVLLTGARGTGKSSSVKALINMHYKKGLRLLQIRKNQIQSMEEIMEYLRNLAGYKFIIFMDDLSFGETEPEYKYLKSIIEGGAASCPENVILYATSNRRHMIKETWNDREDTQEELYKNDSINESISLADRFGIIVTYDTPDQNQYLSVIKYYLQKAGIHMDAEELRLEGIRWEMLHSGRSGRTAKQFVNWYLGQKNN